MDTTLTIHDLDEHLWQALRLRAVRNGRSIEAEAKDILTSTLSNLMTDADSPVVSVARSAKASSNKGKFDHVIGIWKGRGTTDEVMRETRGED